MYRVDKYRQNNIRCNILSILYTIMQSVASSTSHIIASSKEAIQRGDLSMVN